MGPPEWGVPRIPFGGVVALSEDKATGGAGRGLLSRIHAGRGLLSREGPGGAGRGLLSGVGPGGAY
jgi:hypothetical protein